MYMDPSKKHEVTPKARTCLSVENQSEFYFVCNIKTPCHNNLNELRGVLGVNSFSESRIGDISTRRSP